MMKQCERGPCNCNRKVGVCVCRCVCVVSVCVSASLCLCPTKQCSGLMLFCDSNRMRPRSLSGWGQVGSSCMWTCSFVSESVACTRYAVRSTPLVEQASASFCCHSHFSTQPPILPSYSAMRAKPSSKQCHGATDAGRSKLGLVLDSGLAREFGGFSCFAMG